MAVVAEKNVDLDLQSFNDVATFIAKENEKLSRGIVASLKADIDNVRAELSNDLDVLANNLETNYDKLDSEQAAQAVRIARLEDTIARMQRVSELVISGIPVVDGESCVEIVNNISKVIGFHSTPVTFSAFRLNKTGPMNNRTTNRDVIGFKNNDVQPLIMVKFDSTGVKSSFIAKYLTFKSLSLKDIGFHVDRRIYIKENLTPSNYKVFRACSDAKRNGLISKLHTKDGICYIGLPSHNSMIAIHSVCHLNDTLGKSSDNSASSPKMHNLRSKRRLDDQQPSDHRAKKGKNLRSQDRS